MSVLRTELMSVAFAAFVSLIVACGVGRAAQLGIAYSEGRLITPWE